MAIIAQMWYQSKTRTKISNDTIDEAPTLHPQCTWCLCFHGQSAVYRFAHCTAELGQVHQTCRSLMPKHVDICCRTVLQSLLVALALSSGLNTCV